MKEYTSDNTWVIMSILAGLLCFFCSSYSIAYEIEDVKINIPWFIIFPMIIALSYGWRGGLLTSLTGAAYFPFYLWTDNGYMNLLSVVVLVILFTSMGYFTSKKKDIVLIYPRFLFCIIGNTILITLSYRLLFNPLLSINPPFWTSNCITEIDPAILDSIIIKNVINVTLLAFYAEGFIRVPFFRRILKMPEIPYMASNTTAFMISIAIVATNFGIFYVLDNFLIQYDSPIDRQYLPLAFTVLIFSAGIVGRIMMIYLENNKRIEIDNRNQLESLVEERTKKLQKVNEDLKKSNEAVRQQSQYKDDFLANMSHEIRTPMNAIIGFVDLMTDHELNKEQQQYLATIQQSANHLLHLINDILDFSKIESNQIILENIPFQLNETIKHSFDSLRPNALEKGLEFRWASDDITELVTKGDPIRLQQVLINLLNNAIKFTHTGYVELKVIKVKQTEDFLTIHFEINDTGIGIAKEKQKHIFEKFNQANTSTTREFGGTGLGLSISKRLVELMGGKLHLESEPGQGASFIFEITLELTQSQKMPKKIVPKEKIDPTTLPEIDILVVDDSQLNLFITSKLLAKWNRANVNIVTAIDGQDALDKATTATFDFILMDIQMPNLNGIDATVKLRQEHNNKAYIVAFTANISQKIQQECIEMGFDDYLHKPVTKEQLYQKLEKYLLHRRIQKQANN